MFTCNIYYWIKKGIQSVHDELKQRKDYYYGDINSNGLVWFEILLAGPWADL